MRTNLEENSGRGTRFIGGKDRNDWKSRSQKCEGLSWAGGLLNSRLCSIRGGSIVQAKDQPNIICIMLWPSYRLYMAVWVDRCAPTYLGGPDTWTANVPFFGTRHLLMSCRSKNTRFRDPKISDFELFTLKLKKIQFKDLCLILHLRKKWFILEPPIPASFLSPSWSPLLFRLPLSIIQCITL